MSFTEIFGLDTANARCENEDWINEKDLHEKLDEFFNFPGSLSFTDFEKTTIAKVCQRENDTSDAALTLSSDWPAIRTTLSRVSDIGTNNLDSPINGIGRSYNTNVNYGVRWEANVGPVCQEELLPIKAEDVVHDNIVRSDCETFFDDFMSRLLAIEVKEARLMCQGMCTEPIRMFSEFQRRSSFMFNRNGTAKIETNWPAAVKLNPFVTGNHKEIEEACLNDASVRQILASIDLHRAAPVSTALTAFNILEMA